MVSASQEIYGPIDKKEVGVLTGADTPTLSQAPPVSAEGDSYEGVMLLPLQ